MNPEPRSPAHAALEIIRRLRDSAHVALLAGGCVRDMLLHRQAKDYDVATDAHPPRVRELFPKARLVGAKFGVVLVRRFDHDVEVATFRSDGTYSDGRHPDEVTFGGETDDARRRDFTINGMFFDPLDDRVIDHVGGRADIEAKLIRTIGDPDRRFGEDHLRMLRAARFLAELEGFSLETTTAEAIRRHATHLPAISPERIWMELERLLAAPSAVRGWLCLVELGLVDHLIDGWRPVAEETARIAKRISALRDLEASPELGLTALFLERPGSEVEAFCRSLRLSNRLTDSTVWMVAGFGRLLDEESLDLADLKIMMAAPAWPLLLRFFTVQVRLVRRETHATLDRLLVRTGAIRAEDVAPPPLLSGDDLSAMGLSPGPRFGEILKAVYREQLNERIADKGQALELARRKMLERGAALR